MTKRKIALARALPILIGTVLFGVIIVLLALRTIQSVNQSEALAGRFRPLAQACQGQPVPQAAAYQNGAPLHPTVAFRQAGTDWVLDPTVLPGDWQAGQAEQAQLVLCLGAPQPLTAPRCQAESSGAAPTRVYGQALTLRLVSARSGDPLATDTLESAADPGCWQEENAPVATAVTSDQLQSWLEPYVVGE